VGGGLDIPHPSLYTTLSNQVKLAFFPLFCYLVTFIKPFFKLLISFFIFFFFSVFFPHFFLHYLKFSDIQNMLWKIYGKKIHVFPTFPMRNLTRFKVYIATSPTFMPDREDLSFRENCNIKKKEKLIEI
jgi:energy-coupling factor transporter transmembrane protein EcfT